MIKIQIADVFGEVSVTHVKVRLSDSASKN